MYIYIITLLSCFNGRQCVFFLFFLPTNTDPGDIVLSSCLEETSPNPLLGQVYMSRGDGK